MIKLKNVLQLKKQCSLNISEPFKKLEGARLYLSPPDLDDYVEWSLVRAKNKNFLRPYEPEWPRDCLSLDFFKRRLKRQAKDVAAGQGRYFLIYEKNTHHVVGGLNLNNIQLGAARQASLGYWLDEEAQGQGYMQESIALVIDYAFDVLKLKRLNAACLPDNNRSINLLKKSEFEEEGYAKKYLQINGHWQDHKLFGLIRV